MILKTRFAIVFLACAVLGAQDQVPPTIRVNTRLVQISVVVHDKNGQPVANLKREDFAIFERGHEQKIALFDMDSAQSAGPRRAAELPLPPNTYSNRGFSARGSVSVILFDGLNTHFADQAYARDQVLRFIRQVQPGDRVAIYVLTDRGLQVLHDFTDDPDPLVKAFGGYRPSQSHILTATDPIDFVTTGIPSIDKILEYLSTPSPEESHYYDKIRSSITLQAMEDIAHHLAALSGRKNLVWMSSGFPMLAGFDSSENALTRTPTISYEQALRTTRILTDANVAIYPVDARGLITDPRFSASKANLTVNDLKRQPIFTLPEHDTMDLLAEQTGGLPFYDRNGLDRAIQAAIHDGEVTYTLGFYFPEKDWDGKFHDLKVRVRRPGTEVRYRKGFVASTNAAPDDRDLKVEVSNMLASTIEATSIGLSARVEPRASEKLNFKLEIAAGDVSLTPQNGRWTGSLEIDFAQFAPDGSTLAQTQQPLALDMAQSDYEEFRNHGLILIRTMNLETNAEVLKIVAVDNLTGRMGSLRIPLVP